MVHMRLHALRDPAGLGEAVGTCLWKVTCIGGWWGVSGAESLRPATTTTELHQPLGSLEDASANTLMAACEALSRGPR